MQRYSLIEKAKQAKIIGIIMGTLSVKGSDSTSEEAKASEALSQEASQANQTSNSPSEMLKTLIKSADKKYYELLIGKLNEPKIQNFTSIDLFVIVACRENSLFYAKQFGKPVITPYELLIALGKNNEWESKVVTDFQKCS